jgi:hypothetical protein
VFYDVKTGAILKETLPKELQDEYDTIWLAGRNNS